MRPSILLLALLLTGCGPAAILAPVVVPTPVPTPDVAALRAEIAAIDSKLRRDNVGEPGLYCARGLAYEQLGADPEGATVKGNLLACAWLARDYDRATERQAVGLLRDRGWDAKGGRL